MEIKRISLGQMPPADKYVAIYMPDEYCDYVDDGFSRCWCIAKCVYGISKAERCDLALGGSDRASIILFGDEWGGNLVPFAFDVYGGNHFYGQEVDIWCDLSDSN